MLIEISSSKYSDDPIGLEKHVSKFTPKWASEINGSFYTND